MTTLHQGGNTKLNRKIRDLEEERDLELCRLRLFEEYRVSRSGIEFQEDIERAKDDHEKLVKICKEKLYSTIENKIKKLKEERLLMDVANVHSYSMDYSRPHFQKNTRSHTTSGWESSPNDFVKELANESATDTGTERRALRRRGATKDGKGKYGSFTTGGSGNNTDESDFQTGYSTGANPTSTTGWMGGHGGAKHNGYNTDANSNSDFFQGISDHEELRALLFGEKVQSEKPENKKKRTSQRYSTKSAPPLQSLNMDEVTEDIALLRQLTGRPPAPFKVKETTD